jgi:SulP family sulfate permease
MKPPKLENLAGDFWGGFAAMLVALPSAIAFGVTIYAVARRLLCRLGALAGILGATALGIVASSMGGTNRLITAPCAPAAAVARRSPSRRAAGPRPRCGGGPCCRRSGSRPALQVLFGGVGLGRLIKYMPYPVVSGYLSGVGLTSSSARCRSFSARPGTKLLGQALLHPSLWAWQAITGRRGDHLRHGVRAAPDQGVCRPRSWPAGRRAVLFRPVAVRCRTARSCATRW